LEGQRLSPVMRADFLARAQSLYETQERTFQGLLAEFGDIAQRRGLDIGNINVGGGLFPAPAGGGNTPPQPGASSAPEPQAQELEQLRARRAQLLNAQASTANEGY